MADEDDDIPLLEDIVRAGAEAPARSGSEGVPLSEAEIEAIAARVVERHTREMEQAVARAIRTALDVKSRGAEASGRGPGRSGGSQERSD